MGGKITELITYSFENKSVPAYVVFKIFQKNKNLTLVIFALNSMNKHGVKKRTHIIGSTFLLSKTECISTL